MTVPSVEDVRIGNGRLSCQEALSLITLSGKVTDDGKTISRYMSRRRALNPGSEMNSLAMKRGFDNFMPSRHAYGGHVYAQASLAASLTYRATRKGPKNGGQDKTLGIHVSWSLDGQAAAPRPPCVCVCTIHGFFSEGGLCDRPFIYEVTNLSSNALFPSFLVTARQPTSPSANPAGDHYPNTDAELPLGPVRFSTIVSFRPSSISQLRAQEPPVQTRFAAILGSRRPMEWDPAPIIDIEGVQDMIPGARHAVGLFPGLDMRKVDMRAYNAGRPLHERRELILYRLLAPLPATVSGDRADADADADAVKRGEDLEELDSQCLIEGPDAHICAHAYAADRNGLLMVGNNVGWGHEFGRAASLSYSFVVHVNAEDAVMTHHSEGDDDDDEQWWVQEACFPRVEAGRAIIHSKIWSPRGVHVATEYQDGIVRRIPRPGDDGGKPKL
ncbi:Thioesterase/thiol ester dehydrase-isomerase [Nemania sp. NC0429]|nr:Thioesterase/thiol ester dehydrase-isomerase [Nemania sp. NC0429]